MLENDYLIKINGQTRKIKATPDTPLLWIIRDNLNLTGTKYGCGKSLCGACTIHLDGSPVRSCSIPISAIKSSEITTIEGISNDEIHPVQKAWIEEDVPQCGYCQAGQIMTAVSLLSENANPTDGDIDAAMSGNICRCGTYPRIKKAVKRAAKY